MKVIITGSTGYIGTSVLTRLISDPRVTSIVSLVRKVPAYTVEQVKVTYVEVPDFANYGVDAVEAVKDADACVWCQGLAQPPSMEIARALSIDYPKTFLDAWDQPELPEPADPDLTPSTTGRSRKRKRFVYLGGKYTVQDQDAAGLWFMGDMRKLRGLTETSLLISTFSHPSITSLVARPSLVTSSPLLAYGLGSQAIRVEELAAALVECAVGHDEDAVARWGKAVGLGRQLENQDLRMLGREVLSREA